MKILLLSFLISILSIAAPELRSRKALHTKIESSTFTATLDEGFHFNDKAPNGFQVKGQLIKPTLFEKQKLVIEKLPEGFESGNAYVYVCDDKVTFCDAHKISLGSGIAHIKQKKPAKLEVKKVHGFILDNYEAALDTAKKKKQIILVDFGARWCPACIRLENDIFASKTFQKLTKDFVKVKIDVDQFSSRVLQEKYNVKGYPTVLFINSEGHEITRFVDYQPMIFFENIVADINKDPRSLTEMEKATPTPESLWKRYFYSDQFEKSLALMEKMEPKPKEYWFAKVAIAKDGERPKYIETLKKAVATEPDTTRSLNWRVSLISLMDKKEDKEKWAREAEELTNKLLSDKAVLMKATETDFVGEYTGLEGFYVAQINAEAAQESGYNQEPAWQKVIEQSEIYKITAKQPGAALRLLTALVQAKEFDQALVLVDSLLKQDPKDGDLQRRKMRVLYELKKYNEAIQIGEKALKNSYGVNEFFVVETLAKSYAAIDKKEIAKKLIETYLSKNEINFTSMANLKKKLEDLNKTL